MKTTWSDLQISESTQTLLLQAGYTFPTTIQAMSIPHALAGKDVIASAQTGTGKTASFVVPLVERFAGKEGTFGLILCPTREIAQQTQATLELLAAPRGIRSAVLIGGVQMRHDEQALKTYPQILVATPGRLCDHLDRGNIWLDFIEIVILDEADRMLDMGFSQQLNRILTEVPTKRQTLLYSATFSPSIEKLARQNMQDPARIAIEASKASTPKIEQRFIWTTEEKKIQQLRYLLNEEPGTVIIFTRSKDRATHLWRSLHSRGHMDATFIHSDRSQEDRSQALQDFKDQKFRILIATDVAARGIHVDGVALVINFDLPAEPEDYIHRIGRTGRQGASGIATSLLTPRDTSMVKELEKLLKITIHATARPRAQPIAPKALGPKPNGLTEGTPAPKESDSGTHQPNESRTKRKKIFPVVVRGETQKA